MNNQIKEDYVSFIIAKLLQEKGFSPENWRGKVFVDGVEQEYFAHWQSSAQEFICRPTHGVAIKWIRENFGIHISSYYSVTDESWGWEFFDLNKMKENIKHYREGQDGANSSEEATEEALLYTLKNLIP